MAQSTLKPVKWLDAVIDALCSMGGKGSLQEIAGRATEIWVNSGGEYYEGTYFTISRTITGHSSDSKGKHRAQTGSNNDIFFSDAEGRWGLRNPEKYCVKTNA